MAWFVLRDLKRPNALEPAWKILPTLGYRVFTPMSEQRVSRHGKVVKERRPIVPDLLFVEGERPVLDVLIARTPTLQYRYVKGQGRGVPMTVRDSDMALFMRAVSEYSDGVRYYTAGEITADMLGREVRIIGGPLDGTVGRLLSRRGLRDKRLVLDLQGLLTATVTIEPELIELM
ncbi:MAG: UpxY family transcription antiterminator [Muribaculaceae bacterium]|nr:UpxY family transcription antiterminator [Muribaculaceae bacterium]